MLRYIILIMKGLSQRRWDKELVVVSGLYLIPAVLLSSVQYSGYVSFGGVCHHGAVECAGHVLPHLSCVGKSWVALRKKVPLHAARLEQRATREGTERRLSQRCDCKGTVAAGGGHAGATG